MHLTVDFHFFSTWGKDYLGDKSEDKEDIVTVNGVKSVACTDISSYTP